LSIRASSGGVQSRGGWLVMMAVIRWRRVGGRGMSWVLRCRRQGSAVLRAGVCRVMLIAVIAVGVWGRLGSRS
jgi:hypothetical protein